MDDVLNCVNEVDLLARLINAEARGEPYDGQLAVGTVVMNRCATKGFPETISDVIYQKNQFAKPSATATDSCRKAAEEVFEGYRSFPQGVLLFQRKKVNSWYGYKWWCKIGAHNFYGKGD